MSKFVIAPLIIFTLTFAGCLYKGDITPDSLNGVDISNLAQVEKEMIRGNTFETLIDEKILQAVKQMVKTLRPEYKKKHTGRYKLGFLEISDINRQSVTRFHNYVTEKALTFSFLQRNIAENFSIVERFLIKNVLTELEFENMHYPPVVDQKLAQTLGKLYHLDVIETGVTTETPDFIDLNLRMIETKRGRIVAVGSVKIEKTEPVKKWLEEMSYGSILP